MEVSLRAFRDMAVWAIRNNPSNGDTVIRLGEGGQGLTANSWTRLGSRTAAEKEGNLATRRALMEALKNEIGDLQLGKKDADSLKLYDFMINKDGAVMSSRPLTARRILALTAGIEKSGAVEMSNLAEADVKSHEDLPARLAERAKQTLTQMKEVAKLTSGRNTDPILRVMASLSEGQMRQLSAVICAKAQARLANPNVKQPSATEVDSVEFIKNIMKGDDVLWNQLATLIDSSVSPAGVSRFLDVLEHAPDTDKGFLAKLVKAIHTTCPEKFNSQETFAEELKVRLGRKISLPQEASGNLLKTIGVLGRQLARDLADYTAAMKRIGLDRKFEQVAEKACQKACKNGLIGKGDLKSYKDLQSYRDALREQLKKHCRGAGRLFMTEADLKISLFIVICDKRIPRVNGDPLFNPLLDDDFAKDAQQIGKTDYSSLSSTIERFCTKKKDQYAAFRTWRGNAFKSALNDIQELGKKFGLSLSQDDINMSSVGEKFRDASISALTTKEAVEAIVSKKKVAGLMAFAKRLENSQIFTPDEKKSLFLTFCKAPSVPSNTFERLEAIVMGYEKDFSKVIQDELYKVSNSSEQVLDRSERNASFSKLTESLVRCVFTPIAQYTPQGVEYGADEKTDLLNVIGNVISGRKDDRLRKFVQFAVTNEGYQAWIKENGKNVGMPPSTVALRALDPQIPE